MLVKWLVRKSFQKLGKTFLTKSVRDRMDMAEKVEIVYRPTTFDAGVPTVKLDSEHNVRTNYKLYFIVVIVNLLAFAAGNALAWPSAVKLRLTEPPGNVTVPSNRTYPLGRPMTTAEFSWTVALINCGGAASLIPLGFLANKLGRKQTMLLFTTPMLVSHLIIAFADTLFEFYIARFLMGIGLGCVLGVVPVFVGEIAETRVRGFLGCFMTVMLTIGILFVYAVGGYVDLTTFSVILTTPIAVFVILFTFCVPESPYFYASQNDFKNAERSLRELRRCADSGAISRELTEIVGTVGHCEKFSLKQLTSISFLKGMVVANSLIFFQQFIGATILIYYMEPIFVATGSSLSASTSTIVVGIVQTVSASLTSLLADRWGRKPLMILSNVGCAVGAFLIGYYFRTKSPELWYLPLVGVLVHVISYSFGMGALPWALLGELFANNIKAFAASATAFVSFLIGTGIVLIYPYLIKTLEMSGTFWFFATNAVLCSFFIAFYVPETKGKSFQEILRALER